LQDQDPIEENHIDHSSHTPIPEEALEFAPVDEQGNEIPSSELIHLSYLSWEAKRDIYRQLTREAKDRIESQCRRLYGIYWLERENLLSEFVRCDWCNSRPREQAVVYLPYKFYLCLNHFHQYDKQRKKSRGYKRWKDKQKQKKEAEQLRERIDKNV
jgi:hypothetical protein